MPRSRVSCELLKPRFTVPLYIELLPIPLYSFSSLQLWLFGLCPTPHQVLYAVLYCTQSYLFDGFVLIHPHRREFDFICK